MASETPLNRSPKMNKFVLEPNEENLERLKRNENGKVYWHTMDFFHFDSKIEDDLSDILIAYVDVESEEDEEKLELLIERMLGQLADRIGVSMQDCRSQLDNYARVVLTPICIWWRDETGKMRYSLKSKL
ncbi:MAG: hypothetical protein ACPGVO_01940 [Spirulinaceae cyanobacterium]